MRHLRLIPQSVSPPYGLNCVFNTFHFRFVHTCSVQTNQFIEILYLKHLNAIFVFLFSSIWNARHNDDDDDDVGIILKFRNTRIHTRTHEHVTSTLCSSNDYKSRPNTLFTFVRSFVCLSQTEHTMVNDHLSGRSVRWMGPRACTAHKSIVIEMLFGRRDFDRQTHTDCTCSPTFIHRCAERNGFSVIFECTTYHSKLNSSSLILSIDEISSYFVAVAIVVSSLFAIRLIRTSSRMSSIQLTTIIMLDFSHFVWQHKDACHHLIRDMRLTLFYCHFCNPNRMNFYRHTTLSRRSDTHTPLIALGFYFVHTRHVARRRLRRSVPH